MKKFIIQSTIVLFFLKSCVIANQINNFEENIQGNTNSNINDINILTNNMSNDFLNGFEENIQGNTNSNINDINILANIMLNNFSDEFMNFLINHGGNSINAVIEDTSNDFSDEIVTLYLSDDELNAIQQGNF